MKFGEQGIEVRVAAGRDGQNEFQWLTTHPNRADGVQIVQAEQTPIGDQHHPLDRVARQDLLDRR
jgi:hypothetical protein